MDTDMSSNMVDLENKYKSTIYETLQEENKQLKIEDKKNKEDVIKKANKYYLKRKDKEDVEKKAKKYYLKRKDKEDVEKKAKKYYLKEKERLPQHILHDIYNFESRIDIK
jgi:hypothetical protein